MTETNKREGRSEKDSEEINSAFACPVLAGERRRTQLARAWGSQGVRGVCTKSGFCYANSNDV
jgi:hypothetical protein